MATFEHEVVGKIVQHLETHPDGRALVSEVQGILQARVPIVKFKHNKTGLACDANCNNDLGLHNTRLLRAYGLADRRFLQLGFAVKRWAKTCEINDASMGYLSSYCLITMLIGYLQRTEPPVLPYLQTLSSADKPKRKHMVHDYDCYFFDFDHAEQLAAVWPGMHANKQSVAELLLGFFRYYTETFQWSEDVVNIRNSAELRKADKGWLQKPMAVEDPFELSHNTSKGVQAKGFDYIIKCMVRMRDHLATVQPASTVDGTLELIYDKRKLQGPAPPPNTNGCHVCGAVGHFARDCPKNRGPVCYYCNEQGHVSRNCPYKQSSNFSRQTYHSRPPRRDDDDRYDDYSPTEYDYRDY